MALVELEDAKVQLRQGGETLTDERTTEIEGFIADAAAWVEDYTGHILEARTVAQDFATFDRARLHAWPIASGTIPVVTYADPARDAVLVPGARIDASARPARVLPAIGSRWPAIGGGAITVAVTAGYRPGDTIPGNFRRAMLMLISAYDADREGGQIFAQAEAAARNLCRPYRRRGV